MTCLACNGTGRIKGSGFEKGVHCPLCGGQVPHEEVPHGEHTPGLSTPAVRQRLRELLAKATPGLLGRHQYRLVFVFPDSPSRIDSGLTTIDLDCAAESRNHLASLLDGLDERDRLRTALRWTPGPPQHDGFYWHRPADSVAPPTIFAIRGGLAHYPHWGFKHVKDLGGFWAGPILPPCEDARAALEGQANG